MLTAQQNKLLQFIEQRLEETGVSPSFEEMKKALGLASKSGVHRLVKALEERGFLRRLPHRARAVEVLRSPLKSTEQDHKNEDRFQKSFTPKLVKGEKDPFFSRQKSVVEESVELPVLGSIAAGTPITAIQDEIDRLSVPVELLGRGEHFALEVQGDSMIEAGILDGDTVIIQKAQTARSGDIIVALIEREEATLKRLRKKGESIALEAANPQYETRIFGTHQVEVQGKLVGLIRRYR